MHHRWPSEQETLDKLRALGCDIGEPSRDKSFVMKLFPVTRLERFRVTTLAISPDGAPLITLNVALRGLGIEREEFWEGLP